MRETVAVSEYLFPVASRFWSRATLAVPEKIALNLLLNDNAFESNEVGLTALLFAWE